MTMIRKFKESLYKRLYKLPLASRLITDHFHRMYYYSRKRTWQNTFWLGTSASKCPLDLWVYQEIIYDLRPDVLVECGTNRGGSAAFFASMFDLVGSGKVLTIDLEAWEHRPAHERITYLTGSSVSPEIVKKVREFIGDTEKVMVVLDSDHSMKHVLNELRIYSDFVSTGQYLVVEDSNVNGYPVEPAFGPGPMEAIERFLREDGRFVTDHDREKFYLTFNPRGFLKRVAQLRSGT